MRGHLRQGLTSISGHDDGGTPGITLEFLRQYNRCPLCDGLAHELVTVQSHSPEGHKKIAGIYRARIIGDGPDLLSGISREMLIIQIIEYAL